MMYSTASLACSATALAQPRAEVAALEVFGHQKGRAVVERADREHARQVLVLDLGRPLRRPPELCRPLDARGGRGPQHAQGHPLFEPHVRRRHDVAQRVVAEQPLDPIRRGETIKPAASVNACPAPAAPPEDWTSLLANKEHPPLTSRGRPKRKPAKIR